MKITYGDIQKVFDYDIIDTYESHVGIIKRTQDWNELPDFGVSLISVAIYVILNNPKSPKKINPDYLKSIRKKVSELKIKYIKNYIKNHKYEWIVDYRRLNLGLRLGRFAKYFMGQLDYDYSENSIKDIRNKYLNQQGAYLDNCLKGIEDEVEIIKEFLYEIELISKELLEEYESAQKRTKRQKEGKKPTDIDNKLKSVLFERLRYIGVPAEKSKRLTVSAITAIKKEILYIL